VQLNIHDRILKAKEMLEEVKSPAYLEKLAGTIGADPLHGQIRALEIDEALSSRS
jgi:hypothetical protein